VEFAAASVARWMSLGRPDDQLGLMDHLGIRQFFFMGYCIGGPFAMKLIERSTGVVCGCAMSAGRASAGEPELYVQFRQECLGQGV